MIGAEPSKTDNFEKIFDSLGLIVYVMHHKWHNSRERPVKHAKPSPRSLIVPRWHLFRPHKVHSSLSLNLHNWKTRNKWYSNKSLLVIVDILVINTIGGDISSFRSLRSSWLWPWGTCLIHVNRIRTCLLQVKGLEYKKSHLWLTYADLKFQNFLNHGSDGANFK